MMLLATQVNVPVSGTATAASQAPVSARVIEVKINTTTADPIQISGQNKPDFDAEVLAPLRSAQAAKAAADRAAAEAAAKIAAERTARAATATTVSVHNSPVIIGGSDAWAQLRFCEAGGDYAKNTGNGYYGAYQYNLSTWANYGGFARPDLAPPAVQDAKAQATQAARGWSPWPACARKLGLL